MYDVFWWCSAMAGMDTRDARAGIHERYPSAGTTRIKSMLPPEEVTTFNFVRRLVFQQKRKGGKAVATLHSRALEGGLRGKRAPSGADLELAVEVRPGKWANLLLQAKRIYESPNGRGVYDGWKSSQIRKLRQWANQESRTPGMLLYNADIPPFGGLQTDVTMDGCCQGILTCHGRSWPPDPWTHLVSPLGVTLVTFPPFPTRLPRNLQGDKRPADVVNRFASPIECIFCTNRCYEPSEKATGIDTRARTSQIPLSDEIPAWADSIMVALGLRDRAYSGTEPRPREDGQYANHSLVLALPEQSEESE